MGRQRGSAGPLCFPLLLLLLQVGGRRCDEAAPCQPGFAAETFTFTVPRDGVAAGEVLGQVLFSGCAGQPQAVLVPADQRFEVDEDGILQTKQPLQLRGQRIRFNVSALDATGKTHSAWVTLEKRRSRQQRRSNQDGEPYMLSFPESGPGLRRQKRDWVIPPISCPENHRGPFPMKLVQIKSNKDKETKVFYSITGQGADSPPVGVFTIERETGWLEVTQPLDREEIEKYVLFSHAVSANGQPVEDPMEIIITVMDQNDNKPVFTKQLFVGYIEENAKPGTSVMTVNATDADDAVNVDNGIVSYSIVSQEPPRPHPQMFTIDPQKGVISVLGTGLDRETTPNYTLIVRATDQEGKGLSTTATAVIEVTDANDNIPVFDPTMYEGTVPENEVGLEVARLHVTDQDMLGSPAWQAVYRIKSGDQDGAFSIATDPNTNDGILRTAKGLDYETRSRYDLVVTVENKVPLSVSLGLSSASVLVLVRDVNEPPVFVPPVKRVEVSEDLPVGHEVTSYTAQDPDKDQRNRITYRMGSDPAGWLAIDPENGIVTAAQPLDRESVHAINSTYKAIVLAVDNGVPDATGTGTLLLLLQDVNDNGPTPEPRIFDICSRQPEEQTLTIVDKDLPPNTYPFQAALEHGSSTNWSVIMSGQDSLLLRLNKELEPGEYSIFLKLTDSQGKAQMTEVKAQVGGTERPQGSLTTHVLNTATGLPAARLALRLAQLQEPGAQWRELAQRWTDEDGRCLPLLPPGQAKAGTYKLHFETAEYWESLGYSSFYPFVEVVFTITDPAQKLHIPLLISPYSYTTYRGS